MLPFRLGIVTGVAALCLWGLFSLLDSLNEPGLLRTTKAVVVKGCDSLDSDEARQQCPALFCQKAVLDAKLVSLQARFEMHVDRAGDENTHLLAGRATHESDSKYFACDLRSTKVLQVRRIEREEFKELTDSP